MVKLINLQKCTQTFKETTKINNLKKLLLKINYIKNKNPYKYKYN
jgi:hypothetical protein